MERSQNLNPNSKRISEEDLKNILFKKGYILKESVGQGGYGKIYKILLNKTNNEYIAKYVEFDEKTEIGENIKKFTIKESDILWNTRHDNILRLFQIINFKNGLLLIIEYAQHGDILKYLDTRVDESVAFAIFYKIYSGVKTLHENKIIHRDLKLENILVNDKFEIKICDFGLSKSITESLIGDDENQLTKIRKQNFDKKNKNSDSEKCLASFVGSPLYLSPEIIRGSQCYFDSVDVWSLGVILYTLLFNTYPFDVSEVSLEEFEKKIINTSPKIDKSISKDCYNLLNGLLQKDYNKRIRIKAIEDSHWIVRMKNDKETHFENLKKFLSSRIKENIFKRNDLSESIGPGLSDETQIQNTEKNPYFCCLTEGNEIPDNPLSCQMTQTNKNLITRKNFSRSPDNAKSAEILMNQQPFNFLNSTYIPNNHNKDSKENKIINLSMIQPKPNSNRQINSKNDVIVNYLHNKNVENHNDKKLFNNNNQGMNQNQINYGKNIRNDMIIPNNNIPYGNINLNQNMMNQMNIFNNNVPRQKIINNQNLPISQNNEKDHYNIINDQIRENPKFCEYVYWLINQDVPNLLKNSDNLNKFKNIITEKVKDMKIPKQLNENSNKINQSFINAKKYTNPKK